MTFFWRDYCSFPGASVFPQYMEHADMIGQQMITEARMKNRKARSIALAHPHAHARHAVPYGAPVLLSIIRPISTFVDTLLNKLRLSD